MARRERHAQGGQGLDDDGSRKDPESGSIKLHSCDVDTATAVPSQKRSGVPSRSLFLRVISGAQTLSKRFSADTYQPPSLLSPPPMPFLAKTMTMESVSNSLFLLLRPSRTLTRDDRQPSADEPKGGVLAHLREELPSGVNSIPLAMYAFMSGYLNAVSFTTSTIWCGFMTGNSVILGLALARVCLGQRRENAFAIVDAQATTALVCFVIGIGLARLGDLSIWAGPKTPVHTNLDEKSDVPAVTVSTPDDVEQGLRPAARQSSDWDESGAPTRVGSPVPFAPPSGKATRIVIPGGPSSSQSSPTGTLAPTPAPRAFGRARLWLVLGTIIQALFLVGAGIATLHDPATPRRTWSSPAGFVALALLSTSMGFQGVMAHRMGSGFGATVVLSSLWVEMVGSPGGLRWREYRGVRVYTILLFIVGGLVGAVLRDAKVLGIANALFVGAAFRVVIAISWLFVKAPRK